MLLLDGRLKPLMARLPAGTDADALLGAVDAAWRQAGAVADSALNRGLACFRNSGAGPSPLASRQTPQRLPQGEGNHPTARLAAAGAARS